jgi:hypothetical protein
VKTSRTGSWKCCATRSHDGAEIVSTIHVARLALGTAQFGLNYGIANRSGRISQDEVSDILKRAAAAGIDTLDTAVAYGESELSLGRAGVSGWRVVTKLPPLPHDVAGVERWIHSQIEGSLQRLGIAQLDAVLLHRPADLLGAHGAEYRLALDAAKRAGLARTLGVSIYGPEEMDSLWEVWRPELVQAPCNVLDRRLIHSGWLERLGNAQVRVHLRSAFLQGLLLMKSEDRPSAFMPWKRLLDRWATWCKENQVAPLHGALAFVCGLPGVERFVIGVDSAAHLQEILGLEPTPAPVPPEDMYCDDKELIDPSRWRAT